jgi:hypothetical protein
LPIPKHPGQNSQRPGIGFLLGLICGHKNRQLWKTALFRSGRVSGRLVGAGRPFLAGRSSVATMAASLASGKVLWFRKVRVPAFSGATPQGGSGMLIKDDIRPQQAAPRTWARQPPGSQPTPACHARTGNRASPRARLSLPSPSLCLHLPDCLVLRPASHSRACGCTTTPPWLRLAQGPTTSTPYSSSTPSSSSLATSKYDRGQLTAVSAQQTETERLYKARPLDARCLPAHPWSITHNTCVAVPHVLILCCMYRVGVNRYNFLLESLQDLDTR